VRVIAGTLRGRRLATPDWAGLRPTSDKLRETIFNILAPRLTGARVLDGFAGTGALGIEAVSRGAAHVTFIENDRRAFQLISDNVRQCGIADRCAIIRADLRSWAPHGVHPFDIILLDPPYDDSDLQRAIVAAAGVAAGDALIVLEHSRRVVPPDSCGEFVSVRRLRSGDSALTLYKRERTAAANDSGDGG
jgi:16S rRNA (guanine966-N2)-methyltransferase